MKGPDPIDHLSALSRPLLDSVALADQGYVQEANRRFFHPLGLHMAVQIVTDDPDSPFQIRVMDCRNVIAGVVYAPAEDACESSVRSRREKAIDRQWTRRAAVRRHRTGIVRQPVNAPLNH